MSSSAFLAWSSPADGASESDFNEWYEGTHIPQVRGAIPAITDVRRYKVVNPADPDGPARYLAVYQFEGAEPSAVAGALRDASSTGVLDQSPTLNVTGNPPEIVFLQGL